MKCLLFSICLFLSVINLEAKIQLPSILGDNMVLQQESSVKIWGKAQGGSKVTVKTSWNTKSYAATTNQNGDWLVTIDTPIAGGPYEIKISDGEDILLKNILIGEVWFCAGQSNMEMPMKGFDRQPLIGATDFIIKAKDKTPIRMFTTYLKDGDRSYGKHPQFDCAGEWLVNSTENVANTSAVAYFFAKYIQDVLDVPVGIIISSWGGSHIESWMSKEAFSDFPEIDLSNLDSDTTVKDPGSEPCVLFNSKVAPITNYSIKGFLWYQGESNRHNPEQYEYLAPAFVKDLRKKWNHGELPFYFVQIAPFNYEGADGTSAARLREAQLQNLKDIPNSGMVTTLDVGHPVFIHPTDKKTVGDRLAYWALAKTYEKTGFGYAPPIYNSMEKKDRKIYINVDNAPDGLCPMWTDLTGFEIAGEDRVFYSAKAEIETESCRLAVSSERVLNPVAVRYAYRNYVEPSVFSIYNIPLAPFRTDNW